jgi:hypothetical protein
MAQAGIVTDYGEPLDEDNDSSERKHNPRMPRIVLIRKSCHERRGRPSLIRDVGGFPTSG